MHDLETGMLDRDGEKSAFHYWRLLLGFTQEEAAAVLLVSVETIGRYDRGERLPPSPTALLMELRTRQDFDEVPEWPDDPEIAKARASTLYEKRLCEWKKNQQLSVGHESHQSTGALSTGSQSNGDLSTGNLLNGNLTDSKLTDSNLSDGNLSDGQLVAGQLPVGQVQARGNLFKRFLSW
jgi:transcriptional regulator with XRE-family HTH domain